MAEVGFAELAMYQQGMTEQQKMMFLTQYNSDKKDRSVVLLVSVVLGYFGVDRFMIGDILIGVLKLLTFGFCGLFWIVDWFLIMNRVDEKNRNSALEIASVIKATGSSGPPP
jgi:TM2 domain-containing membrane protein YozV